MKMMLCNKYDFHVVRKRAGPGITIVYTIETLGKTKTKKESTKQ